jgi:hypothetical protein
VENIPNFESLWTKSGVVYTYKIPNTLEEEIGRLRFKASLDQEWAVVEWHLSSKYKTLNSIHSTAKKKKKYFE